MVCLQNVILVGGEIMVVFDYEMDTTVNLFDATLHSPQACTLLKIQLLVWLADSHDTELPHIQHLWDWNVQHRGIGLVSNGSHVAPRLV